MLNKTIAALVALAGTASIGVIAPTSAMASSFYPTHISVNGTTTSSPEHTVAYDGTTQTSFLPIWYIDQALPQLGVTADWNGVTGVLNLQVPSTVHVDLSALPAPQSTGSSRMAIAINGTVVSYAPRISLHDPANGVMTTYAPLYYLETSLKRIGITSGWNGTDWTMLGTVDSGSQPSGSGQSNGNYETEQSMTTAMWNLFNATTFDVDQHPTMAQAGVTLDNPTGAVTASQVATWLADWATKAKGITYMGTYHPYSLQYESSSDPYTWASENGLFQGTGISSSSSQITPSQANTIISNLRWWLNGYKVSGGVYTMHVPFISHYAEWRNFTQGQGAVTEANYQSGMAQALSYFDRIQISGTSTLHVTLPNSSGTNVLYGFTGDSGNYEYGVDEWSYDPSKPEHGGVTLSSPNPSNSDINLDVYTFGIPNSNENGIGYVIDINDKNGSLDMSSMIDGTADQS